MDQPLVRVLRSADLAVSAIRRVRADGTHVLVARLSEGEVVAFATTCPHQRTDLEGADLLDGLVRCPLHAYIYDARTGENVQPYGRADPRQLWRFKPGYLPVHPVEERDGWIWVGPDPLPPPPSYDPAREQPPAAPAQPAEPLGPTDILRVAKGTTFELRLPPSDRPGFVWRVETGSPALAVVQERRDGEHHLVKIAARADGRSTVTCRYARPWDREPADVRRFQVTVYS